MKIDVEVRRMGTKWEAVECKICGKLLYIKESSYDPRFDPSPKPIEIICDKCRGGDFVQKIMKWHDPLIQSEKIDIEQAKRIWKIVSEFARKKKVNIQHLRFWGGWMEFLGEKGELIAVRPAYRYEKGKGQYDLSKIELEYYINRRTMTLTEKHIIPLL